VHAHRRRIYGFAAPVGLGDTVPISSRTLSIRIRARKASGASWSRAVIANGLAAARITDRAATTRPATWTHPTWSIVAATENTAVDMNRAASTRSSTTVSAKASLGVGLVNARTMGGMFVASSVRATRMAPTSSQHRGPARYECAHKTRQEVVLSPLQRPVPILTPLRRGYGNDNHNRRRPRQAGRVALRADRARHPAQSAGPIRHGRDLRGDRPLRRP